MGSPANQSSSPSDTGRLNGWKEIASFLGRGVRTVQRWEKTLGLPVHRIAYERGDIVFAFKAEIEAWQREASGRRAMAEEKPGGPPATHPWRRLAVGAAAAIALAALAWSRLGPGPVPVSVARQLTSAPGWESEPQISPDGAVVAYVSDDGGTVDLWVVDARGGEPLRLTTGAALESHPTWFPDGRALAFVSSSGSSNVVLKVPRLGGTPGPLLNDADQPAISPDGTRVAFVRVGDGGGYRIFVASVSDPASTRMVTTSQDGLWNHEEPAWSPDGTTICYAAARDLWVVPAAGGRARRLTTDGEYDREPRWSSDGRYVLFSSFRGGSSGIWRVPASGGRPARITTGSGPERFASVSRDGSRLAYATYADNPDVVIRDLHSGAERQFGTLRDEESPVLSLDGRAIVYVSDRLAGQMDVWRQKLSETGQPDGPPTRLTNDSAGGAQPSCSPDGRWVAYHRALGGQRDIWVAPIPAGPPIQFTTDPALDVQPDWSPDGKQIVFVSDRGGGQHLWVAPVENGRPAGPARRLTTGSREEVAPAWSPDGARIAFVVANERLGSEVWTVGAKGGEARPLTTGASALRVAWEPRSGALLVSGFWGADQVTIRRIDPDTPGSPASPPLAWLGPIATLADFSVSQDGRWLAFSRPDPRGDIWVLDAVRGKY